MSEFLSGGEEGGNRRKGNDILLAEVSIAPLKCFGATWKAQKSFYSANFKSAR
jgi:hypothetical protein